MARTLDTSAARIAVVGTYPPQRCGIATFSADLLHAVAASAPKSAFWAVALDDQLAEYSYPPEVQFIIRKNARADYRTAAEFLNMQEVDAVSVQHEFGIYGGTNGNEVLRMLRSFHMPAVTTLHTVLQEPSAEQKEILSQVAALSDRIVVMSKRARRILNQVYGVALPRIAVIPHGVPDVPFLDTSYHKGEFNLSGKKVILTFGLLSRGKGLESVIAALPHVLSVHPDAVFVIAGQTHPGVVRHEGEAYRDSLKRLAAELGVEQSVIFNEQFMDDRKLVELLSTGDVFVTPYLEREQIVSGVLSFALGAGKAIISTPYWYAEEMLADGRGQLVPFADSEAMGTEIVRLLSDDGERQAMRKRAYDYARKMVWSHVSGQYLKLFAEVHRERTLRPRVAVGSLDNLSPELPKLSFDHLKVLSDDTGILQHASFGVPNRDHGYCTDDNARALIVALLGERAGETSESLAPLAYRYLGFLQHAFNPDIGRFRNFMSFDRRWLEEVGSDDSHGRAMWALGHTIAHATARGMVGAATRLFDRALSGTLELKSPRARAFSLVGIDGYLRRFPGATEVQRARVALAIGIEQAWRAHATDEWPWLEDTVTYANAIIPQALILAGSGLDNADMVGIGLRALRWLVQIQTDPKGYFIPIGNQGWMTRDGKRARFDQQPIEAQHMVDALLTAYKLTSDRRWLEDARQCFDWFTGRNDLQQSVADPAIGACGDGLSAERINPNQGAESTLAWLHALTQISTVAEKRPRIRRAETMRSSQLLADTALGLNS